MVNFWIVGCGHIAKKHVQALEHITNARLVAVRDNDLQRTVPFVELGKILQTIERSS